MSFSSNLSDSLYYYTFIIESYTYLNKNDSVAKFTRLKETTEIRFSNKLEQSNARNSFLELEIQESEKKKAESEKEKQVLMKNMQIAAVFSVLSLIMIIIILSNRRKVAKKNKELALLNQQLDEKANLNLLLVKEMHHRVKNNLYLIYSLLELQERKSNSNETKDMFLVTRQRIESIAINHEQLYNQQYKAVNMKEYFTRFVHNIICNHADLIQIVPLLEIENSILINAGICLPIAMLFNEWITNTAKYAETPENKIYIYINASIQDHIICITYHDSGLPAVIQHTTENGLGISIIDLLCKQINAVLITNHNNKAFHYKISFNL